MLYILYKEVEKNTQQTSVDTMLKERTQQKELTYPHL